MQTIKYLHYTNHLVDKYDYSGKVTGRLNEKMANAVSPQLAKLQEKKKQVYEDQIAKNKEELTELLEQHSQFRAKVYPNLNWVKYAYVTFKSIEAQEEFIKIFRDAGCSGCCKDIKLCERLRFDEDLQFYGSQLNVSRACEPEYIEWESLKLKRTTKLCRRCLSLTAAFWCALAAFALLTLYQYWIDKYEKSLEGIKDATTKFWGEFNVLVQSILLSLVNVVFELIFEALTNYEKWEERPTFFLHLFSRLTNLEFFVTAFASPVILSSFMEGKFLFGVINDDITSNVDSEFDQTWYSQHGMGIFIQMFIYFFVNNIIITYLLAVFPKWIVQRRDKRDDYTEEEKKKDIPNTKCTMQHELEEVYAAPDFDVTTRYVYFYITLLCCMLLSSTTPCLYPCAAIIYGITYFSDKYLLLNFHEKTKSFNDVFHVYGFLLYVPFAAICHLVGSIYSFYMFNYQMQNILNVSEEERWGGFQGWVHIGMVFVYYSAINCCRCLTCLKFMQKEISHAVNQVKDPDQERIQANNYLHEIPIKFTQQYYQRMNETLTLCK